MSISLFIDAELGALEGNDPCRAEYQSPNAVPSLG